MMFKYTLSVAFASAFALGTFISSTGCAGDDDTGPDQNEGGGGGSVVSSVSSSSGAGGSPSAVPCVDSGDCDGGRNSATCSVEVCVNGYCAWVFDGFGVLCGEVPKICDGHGHCGEWMPTDTTSCYEASPWPAVCPICDDGDPATADNCVTDPVTNAKHCEHAVLSDGLPCGFNYTMKGGACCPRTP